MIKFKKLFVTALSLIAPATLFYPGALAKTKSYKIRKNDTKFIAHAGYRKQGKKYRKNSHTAFVAAGKAGFQGCEADIRETKDHVLVCSHHNNNDRRGCNIRGTTWKTLHRKYPNLTTCGSFLRTCVKYKMVPTIDLKVRLSDTGYKKLFDLLYTNKYKSRGNYCYFIKNGKKVTFRKEAQIASMYMTNKYYKREGRNPNMISPAINYCRKHYGFTPVAMYFINTKRKGEMYQAKSLCKKYHLQWIGLREPQTTKKFADYCKKNNIKLNCWVATGNVPESRARLYKFIHNYKIDSYTTDKVWW